MPRTNFHDIVEFHVHFDLNYEGPPRILDADLLDFRTKFMQEELEEFTLACFNDDLCKAADALVDLVYVALGTAFMMGVPWESCWDNVHAANMKKVRALRAGDSKRGSAYDVVKPAGWQAPDHREALGIALTDGLNNEHLYG